MKLNCRTKSGAHCRHCRHCRVEGRGRSLAKKKKKKGGYSPRRIHGEPYEQTARGDSTCNEKHTSNPVELFLQGFTVAS
jgi:hypothetical protein